MVRHSVIIVIILYINNIRVFDDYFNDIRGKICFTRIFSLSTNIQLTYKLTGSIDYIISDVRFIVFGIII